MLPIEILLYEDERGRCPFGKWFDVLDDHTARRIRICLDRLANGNTSNVKNFGSGVSELKMNFGPGYRVYFGRDGKALILLLTGGTKKRQNEDIARAQACWANYRRQKQAEK